MTILDPAILGVVACDCGRIKSKRHCPQCGIYTAYPVKRTVQRVDPVSGEMKDYNVFRCKGCGQYYDYYQFLYECNAPKTMSKLQQTKNEKQEHMDRTAKEAAKGIIVDPQAVAHNDHTIRQVIEMGRYTRMSQEFIDRAVLLGWLKDVNGTLVPTGLHKL